MSMIFYASAKKRSAFLGMGQNMGQDVLGNHRANAQRQPGDKTYLRKQNPTHSHTPHNQRLIFQQENRQGEKRADLRVYCVHILYRNISQVCIPIPSRNIT